MRSLTDLTPTERAALVGGLKAQQIATLEDIRLPEGCIPRTAPITFIQTSASSCEAHISARVRYAGTSPFWRDVFGAEATEGAYLMLAARDLPTLLENLDAHIRQGSPAPAGAARLQPASRTGVLSPGELTELSVIGEAIERQSERRLIDPDLLSARLRQGVRGQNQALDVVSHRVAYHHVRRDPRRPLTMMFLGSTGTGKTRTAELLPEALNEQLDPGAGYRFFRQDMAELGEPSRVAQLLGAPPGYVGHLDGAPLVDTLRESPRTVVLLDEIEKAHPAVLRTMMSAMDAGRITAARTVNGSATIDCRHAVFIATSNLAADEVNARLRDHQALEDQVVIDATCRAQLKAGGIAPELLGRITACLFFRPLPSEVLAEVVTLAVVAVAREYGVDVRRIQPAVVVAILEHTRVDSLGARPFEYAVDALLAPAFVQSLQDVPGLPVQVLGPPFACAALVDVGAITSLFQPVPIESGGSHVGVSADRG